MIRVNGNSVVNALEIDLQQVSGYSRLSECAKAMFEKIYIKHINACGIEAKLKYVPKRVTEHKDHLKVYMVSGDWFHYYPNGTWG